MLTPVFGALPAPQLGRASHAGRQPAPKFVGVLHPGTDAYALWALGWSDFVSKYGTSLAAGLRLRSVATYIDNGTPMYLGAYRAGTGPQALYRTPTWEAFDQIWKTQADVSS